MSRISGLKERLQRVQSESPILGRRVDPVCPFCGHDPYEYVDNGVCMEAVAVNCCEFGEAFFDWRIDCPIVSRIGNLLQGDSRRKRRGERLLAKLEDQMEAAA